MIGGIARTASIYVLKITKLYFVKLPLKQVFIREKKRLLSVKSGNVCDP